MSLWMIAGVQMDCRLGDRTSNLTAIRSRLADAARRGARLIVFPECILSGYGFASRAEAARCAEPLPGPSTAAVAADCARLGVWAVYGLLEAADDKIFNACALVGPTGYLGSFRKIHLPCLGADRFTDPGDRPFAVQDLGGLKIGMNICFDGSFPESSRILTLLGADLIVLPTNWADNAFKMATLVPRVRAFENHIYYLAVNRVGTESGFHYIGHSSFSNPVGDNLASADHDREAVLYGEVDPTAARSKRVVHCAGEYEIDRVNWRRPDVYGPLVETPAKPFRGLQSD
jgi:predicted amidohydrolase